MTPTESLAAARVALDRMVRAFEPFRSKPMGAPHSEARARQDEQIAAHDAAKAVLRELGL